MRNKCARLFRGHAVLLVALHARDRARDAPAVDVVPLRVLFPRGGEARADIARLDTADLNAEGLDLVRKRHGIGVDGGLAGRIIGLERDGDRACDGT